MKDRYSYVAVFTYEEDGIVIEFPDLPGCYPCADKDDTEVTLHSIRTHGESQRTTHQQELPRATYVCILFVVSVKVFGCKSDT